MAREPSDVVRAPRCPGCNTRTHRVILAGKQAVCINTKCQVTRFTVQRFGKPGAPRYVKNKPVRENKSYNNSGKTVTPRKRRQRRGEE